MTTTFAITFDYLCPFARNASEAVVEGLHNGADWNVTFKPFSLAQTKVEPNGAWEDWYEIEVPITDPGGAHELYIVFTNPNGGGGLMNLDRVCFLRAGQTAIDLASPTKADE